MHVVDVNLNEQVLSTIEYLRPEIVDDNIFLSLVLFSDLWMISVDPGEIRGMLVALLADSCKSLPGGGQIAIETANLPLGSAGSRGLRAGEYVMLSLSDTGASRSTAVDRRLAKNMHKVEQAASKSASTPASTYDFVRKSGGELVRYNGHGPGATIRLFFPRCRQQTAINGTLPLVGLRAQS